MKHLYTHGAYDHAGLLGEAAFLCLTVESVRRIEFERGLEMPPWRWVVERTFAWVTCWRRHARDYEARIDASEAMNQLVLGSMLLRRISH